MKDLAKLFQDGTDEPESKVFGVRMRAKAMMTLDNSAASRTRLCLEVTLAREISTQYKHPFVLSRLLPFCSYLDARSGVYLCDNTVGAIRTGPHL